MKYANSIKYMNSFPLAKSGAEISQKRISELCMLLGRVNIGTRYICLPSGQSGHASAVLLEAIIEKAGLRVGRICSEFCFDSRESVYINKRIPSIEDYNKSVDALHSVIEKMNDKNFCREEVSFVLSLLLCKLYDCDIVILEGTTNADYSLDSICAPYDLIVIPTVYEIDGANEIIKPLCDSIRRGVREVITGNQRSDVYNSISNSCAMSGVRLYIPVKSQFEVIEASLKKLAFSYGGRDGYSMRSPSYILRDAAILCIETALAIRRAGVKIPWSAIQGGLCEASGMSCFDLISASPILVTDSAKSREEVTLLLKTLDSLGVDCDKLAICLPFESIDLLKSQLLAFEGRNLDRILILANEGVDVSALSLDCNKIQELKALKSCAKSAVEASRHCDGVICFGSVDFAAKIKAEILKIMSF